MPVDFSKVTPAPWEVDTTKALGAYGVWTGYATHPGHDGAGYPSQICQMPVLNSLDREQRDANAAAIALLRNAQDVQMRRKWWSEWHNEEQLWVVHDKNGYIEQLIDGQYLWFCGPDPDSPLIEADEWFKEHDHGVC